MSLGLMHMNVRSFCVPKHKILGSSLRPESRTSHMQPPIQVNADGGAYLQVCVQNFFLKRKSGTFLP